MPNLDEMSLPDFEARLAEMERDVARLRATAASGAPADSRALGQREAALMREVRETYSNLTPMQTVEVSRFFHRPMTLDYINHCFDEFFELHGDRRHPEDNAIIGGLARLGPWTVMAVGHQRGHSVKERTFRNGGMPTPDGLRKAHRLVQMAERFGMPVIAFVDTPGAFPGAGAEEKGMMQAIARGMLYHIKAETPLLSVVIGEGGSGGALAMSIADCRMILRYAIFSVISPEGCSSILWRDPQKAPVAAQLLKLTAPDLLEMNIVDRVIDEPVGGAHRFAKETMDQVKAAIREELETLLKVPIPELIQRRQERVRAMGDYRIYEGAEINLPKLNDETLG